MTTQEAFLKDRQTADWLASFVLKDTFVVCAAYVRAILMEDTSVTPDMIKGAQKFERILRDLPIPEQPDVSMPSSGINHDLSTTKAADKRKK